MAERNETFVSTFIEKLQQASSDDRILHELCQYALHPEHQQLILSDAEWGSHESIKEQTMATILVRMGDIFEGSSDLTILPCSAKGTISSATGRWKQVFGIKAPKELELTLQLGSVSDLYAFPGPQTVCKNFCYAASVLNDHSSSDVITRIGAAIGRATAERSDIRIVESPLLGTGAGGLSTLGAGRALAKGFASTAAPDAQLFIFVYDHERFKKLEAALTQRVGPLRRLWGALGLRPGIFGFSVDLKRLMSDKQDD